jgi:hypothetical protein
LKEREKMSFKNMVNQRTRLYSAVLNGKDIYISTPPPKLRLACPHAHEVGENIMDILIPFICV